MEPSNQWIVPTIAICLFGFIKELRPVEAFLTPFLISKNITEIEVESQIYPIWTYSYAAALIPVFILTDVVRYKPVIIAEGLALIGSGMVMIFGNTVGLMQLMQCLYGVATAADIGYYAYLYAVVPPERYQAVSSYTRSAYLAGSFLSSVLGQLFTSFEVMSFAGLNIFGTVSVTIATLISLFLPRAKKSLFFHQTFTNEEGAQTTENDGHISHLTGTSGYMNDTISSGQDGDVTHFAESSDCHVDNSPGQVTSPTTVDQSLNASYDELDPSELASNNSLELCCVRECRSSDSERTEVASAGHFAVWKRMLREFWVAYSDWRLLQWSLWWSIATCGFFQVGNYTQNLWDLILEGHDDELYYGAVDAVSTLLGALSAFFIMYVKVNWDVYGELLMGVMSLLDCALLVIMGLTSNIWIAYINYIIFRASYQLLITIASFQIAKFLTVERYALVFGWNTFVALVLQTLLTVIVVDSHGLHLPADTQFVIYGGYFGLLGGAFLVKASLVLYKMCRQSRTSSSC